jgi:hypothetical protein
MPRGGTALSKQVELVYQDQSAEELVYRLFRGPAGPGWVAPLAVRELAWDQGTLISLKLVPGGHCVEIATGGPGSGRHHLTEIMLPGDRPQGEELDSFSLRAAVSREYELPAMRLEVQAQLERFGRADRRDWIKRARERLEAWMPGEGDAGWLLVRRSPPSQAQVVDDEPPAAVEPAAALSTLGTHPVSLLVANPAAGRVRAIHSFPAEALLAVCETRLTLAPAVVP